MTFTLLLPTYNEKDNIKPLLKKIGEIFHNSNKDFEILFVDDSSDETPQIIQEEINKRNFDIKLIHRPKEERAGLATAFTRGFQEAKGKYICCMDSDLQHPPEIIKPLIKKVIKNNADMGVASRYIKGGNAKGLGGLYRRLVSIGLKYFVQILFIPTRKTSDPGSGFFVFRKKIIEKVKLQPKGFKILIEILMRTKFNKVVEVPYEFLPRENDDSKATIGQGIEMLKQMWTIFKTVPEAGRFIKFCIVGASGVLVNLGVLYVLVEFFGMNKSIAWIISVALSILSNFLLNNVFTYSDRQAASKNESLKRVVYYYVISTATMIFNFLVFRLGLWIGLYYILAALIGILLTTFLNFILVTKFIWKKKSVTSQKN